MGTCIKVENITNLEEESGKSEQSHWFVALDFFKDIFDGNDDDEENILEEPEMINKNDSENITENGKSNQTELFILKNVTKIAVEAEVEEARFFFPDDKNSIAQKSECLPFIEKLKFCEENSLSSTPKFLLQNIYHVLKSNATLNASIR